MSRYDRHDDLQHVTLKNGCIGLLMMVYHRAA